MSVGNAGKGLGETRAYALMPQPETGKMSCIHHLPCARLSPGVRKLECGGPQMVPRCVSERPRSASRPSLHYCSLTRLFSPLALARVVVRTIVVS